MKAFQARSFQTFILVLIALGLIALALGGYLAPVFRLVIQPFVQTQYWLSTRYQAIEDFLTAPQDLARLRQRNAELESEVSRLQAEVLELKRQISETRILEALVDFARVHPENRYIGASVIGRDPSPFMKYVLLNRGSDHGIRHGMPVVTAQGLVGRIVAVTAGASRAQLITDAASSVNVRLEPSGAQAVLLGSLTGELSLDMIPQVASVKVGDLVMTSGVGGNYPANILIGQVISVRRLETELFQTATVQPVVDFSRLEIVLIIINFRPIEIGPLMPTPVAP